MLKVCRNCHRQFDANRNEKDCPDCHDEMQAKIKKQCAERYRKSHLQYYADYQRQYLKDPDHHQKHLQRVKTGYAIRTHKIQKSKCAICGAEKTECHHITYTGEFSTLAVVYLCKSCHEQVHKQKG